MRQMWEEAVFKRAWFTPILATYLLSLFLLFLLVRRRKLHLRGGQLVGWAPLNPTAVNTVSNADSVLDFRLCIYKHCLILSVGIFCNYSLGYGGLCVIRRHGKKKEKPFPCFQRWLEQTNGSSDIVVALMRKIIAHALYNYWTQII